MKSLFNSKDEVISRIEQIIIDTRTRVASTINYTLYIINNIYGNWKSIS